MTDRDDRHRFRNLDAAEGRGLPDVLRWRLTSRRHPWPPRVVDPPFPPPPPSVAPGAASVTFVGHSTLLVRLPLPGGGSFAALTDPIWSERCSPLSFAGPRRARAPGLPLDALPRPNVVLVSHNHYDHMDLPTLRALRDRFGAPVVTTLGNRDALARAGLPGATELGWWDATDAGPARITCTPARHFSARTPFDRDRTLWGGFTIEAGGHRVLFAGDSGAGRHWAMIRERLGAPDLALLPIGAYEPRWFMAPVHMDPAEAVEARAALGARRAVGTHFGTFQLTDEAIDAPERALAVARERSGLVRDQFDTLGFGETRAVPLG